MSFTVSIRSEKQQEYMNKIIEQMLTPYQCQSTQDYENALKEIIQEITLLGLWRAKFFEHAAFYGGTALRILYGLDRFSEDLDFSLLIPNPHFSLASYTHAIEEELNSLGIQASVNSKIKSQTSSIDSAFIKANTLINMINISAADQLTRAFHKEALLTIKLEVDIDPPPDFNTESKVLLRPIPFSVLTYQSADLFAGKIHALLCRKWKNRVKGRDWYDFIWYISQKIPVHAQHLKARLVQTQAWPLNKTLDRNEIIALLTTKIMQVDFVQAGNEVKPFTRDPLSISLWSNEFFIQLLEELQVK